MKNYVTYDKINYVCCMKVGATSMEYVIEQLVPSDYKKCSNIWNMNKQPNTQKWFNEIVEGNRLVFVYKVNDDFIGEGALVFENGDPDYTIKGQRIYLSRMIVKPGYRNKGIGSIIVDYLADYAKQLGYKEMSLGVDIDNVSARHLYVKKGFINIIFEGEDEYGKYVKLIKTL
ncbi:Acetyltransferase (GNAT) family protein [Sporomusa ovata DSM 2662]|nr:acetyltransferase [Sporomusa ovata DSM 2662]